MAASSPMRISQMGLPMSGQQSLCSGILRVPNCGSEAKQITFHSFGSYTSLSRADLIWARLQTADSTTNWTFWLVLVRRPYVDEPQG